MQLFWYRLTFPGPVRFGATGIGLEETELTYDADGLTSAFLNALAEMEGSEAVERFIKEAGDGDPPVIFSSLFPYGPDPNQNHQEVFLLPRPLSTPPADNTVLRTLGKDLKQIRFLRPRDAARWLGQEKLSREDLEAMCYRSSGLPPSVDPHGKGWSAEELRPRVALDRATSASNLWACAAVRFARGAGLYGLVHLRDDWRELWLQTMQLLGEMGLGGERTYGFGEFKVSGPLALGDVWQPLLEMKSGRYLLLSPYFPAPAEKALLSQALVAWSFLERRGYVVSGRQATTLKRHRVRLLVPGSVLSRPLAGAFADVTPDNHLTLGLRHLVYRCGLAFSLPAS